MQILTPYIGSLFMANPRDEPAGIGSTVVDFLSDQMAHELDFSEIRTIVT